jgi:hypothetical protein
VPQTQNADNVNKQISTRAEGKVNLYEKLPFLERQTISFCVNFSWKVIEEVTTLKLEGLSFSSVMPCTTDDFSA